MNKGLFLDRDGVINRLRFGGYESCSDCYVTKWSQFEFLPGVMDAFRLIRQTDYMPIVISNQSGIGRGYASFEDVEYIFTKMKTEIQDNAGAYVLYDFCPHAPDAGCACRKPSPGMLYKAAIEHNIDLSKSWMVGDSNTDIEAGHKAGVPNLIKILDAKRYELFKKCADAQANGRMVIGPYLPPESERQCRFFCSDLQRAVEYILEQEAEKC